MSDLATRYAQHRYFDVILTLSDLSDSDFDQLAASSDLVSTLQLAADCATALQLPALGSRIHLRAIHTLRRQQRAAEAASVLDRALKQWPEDAGLHLDSALFFDGAKQDAA